MTKIGRAFLWIPCSFSGLFLLAFEASVFVRWEAAHCSDCRGWRFETAKLWSVSLGTVSYETRLGRFMNAGNDRADRCAHQRRDQAREGGWELFLAETRLFGDRED